ncbi:MAG: ribosome recycling factor, partial [Candidatus Limnocylindrus sp.]
EHITVDHYGAKTPLNQMAGISVPENTLLVVQPWDPTAIPAIEKALNSAQLGMTPAVDGNIIRLRVPSMTEERRKDLVKQMGKRTEEARIEIRNARRVEQEAIKKLEKAKEIGEDDSRRRLDALQKATDAKIAEIDRMASSKEREVLEG